MARERRQSSSGLRLKALKGQLFSRGIMTLEGKWPVMGEVEKSKGVNTYGCHSLWDASK